VVQAADQLGPQPAQIVIALGEDSHDLAVVGLLHRAKISRAQGGDGDRERVVGIVLLRTSGAEDPDARDQSGWDGEDHFTGIDELLGQQGTEPIGGLDGPGALGERLGPSSTAVC
jgi:hypothetical protein